MKRVFFLIAALSLFPGVSSATGHSKTQALTVRGAVSQDCTLATNSMTFPNIGVGYLHSKNNPPVVQPSSLSVRCTKGASVQVAMDAGLYGSKAGAQFGSRSMKSSPGKSYIGYDLCHDSACASIWTPSGYTYHSTSDVGSTLPVYGRIPAGQQNDAGSYGDTVTVTVSF